jgi:hypothetical protein
MEFVSGDACIGQPPREFVGEHDVDAIKAGGKKVLPPPQVV